MTERRIKMDTEGKSTNDVREGLYIGEEERIRHDALFFSQSPDDGLLLSGERARSLFIKSKLPLQELSKIWKLADVTRNNMLDEAEFAVAVHLIQRRLCGFDIPDSIPSSWRPESRPLLVVSQITEEELGAYGAIFDWTVPEDNGLQSHETVLKFLGTSGLPANVLANIWDLADVDRDGRINSEEFCIALHLTRYCVKNDSSLNGSVDVVSMMPKKKSEESLQDKRRRRTEYQTEMRKLRSLKDKLQSELINAESDNNNAAKTKIQCELDKTGTDLNDLTTKEANVGKEITQMNLQTTVTTNIEVLYPFDRSFLMKRQSCGIDFLKTIQYKPGQCFFCDGVGADIFAAGNIFEFVRSLPVNKHCDPRRRASRNRLQENNEERIEDSSQDSAKGLSRENHCQEQLQQDICNNESSSSADDESDSVDIGIRRKKRNRPRSKRDNATKEPANQKRIRSLSEAINDIEARNRAAREEVDKRMLRSQSESEYSAEGTATDSSNEDRIAKRKEAYKRRSTSAKELFQTLFSSDSETASDREFGTRKRSLKNLQKTPWNESNEIIAKSSSSESENKQVRNSGKTETGRKSSRPSLTDDRDLVISVVKYEKDEFDFETRLAKSDGDGTSFAGSAHKEKKIYQREKDNTAIGETLSLSERISNEDDYVTEIGSLDPKPIETSGSKEKRLDVKSRKQIIVDGKSSANEVEEEPVAPLNVILNQRVHSLIDMLEETSCDSIEEETFRRKLSESGERNAGPSKPKAAVAAKTDGKTDVPEMGIHRDINLNASTAKSKGKILRGDSPGDSNTPQMSHFHSDADSSCESSRPWSRSDGATSGRDSRLSSQSEKDTSDVSSNDNDGQKIMSAGKKSTSEDGNDANVKKRKVLRTKSGHIVRSKSVHGVHGLRNYLDPEKISFVEECEWLDALVQTELEIMQRRKLEDGTHSPKIERKERQQLFTRSETIDERSLNLRDSRKLVKSLLDMEVELKREKELAVNRREKRREKEKNTLQKEQSMAVGEAGLREVGEDLSKRVVEDTVEQELSSELESEFLSDEDKVEVQNQQVSAAADVDTGDVVQRSSTTENAIKVKREDPALMGVKNEGQTSQKHAIKEQSHAEKVPEASFEARAREAGDSSALEVVSSSESEVKLPKKENHGTALAKDFAIQGSSEANIHLKDIKTFKEIFEEKSNPVRPVDNYHKSLSMDVRPAGLGKLRSRSFGEGLNRPSEDSRHIHVFEKQSSLEKNVTRKDSDEIRSRDIVYCEEAKMESVRKKSHEEIKAKGRKSESVLSGEKPHAGAIKAERASSLDEDSIPAFKKVGEFKQMFEVGLPHNETHPKKKIVITKRSQSTMEEHQKDQNSGFSSINALQDNVKSQREDKNKASHKQEAKVIMKPKEVVSTGLDSQTKDELKSSADAEETIPSIKDRLMLFQVKDEAKVRDAEIRKVRPKSFHGGSSALERTDDAGITKHATSSRNVGSSPTRTVAYNKLSPDREIRDLGELMLERSPEAKGQHVSAAAKQKSVQKRVKEHGIGGESSKVSELPMKSTKDSADLHESNDTGSIGGSPAVDEFLYKKVVKDDRIKKELEEQEAREAEIRARMLSCNSSSIGNSGNIQSSSYSSSNIYSASSDGSRNSSVSGRSSCERTDSERAGTLTASVSGKKDEEPFSKHVNANGVFRTIMDEGKSRGEAPCNRKGSKEMESNEKHEEKGSKKTARQDASKETALHNGRKSTDVNGNFTTLHGNEDSEKNYDGKEVLKSRRMPNRIELELEEERRREEELEEERKRREEELNKVLEEQKSKTKAMEEEKKRVEEEKLAKQNALLEEKMKRQERTRGLRALFETT